MFYQGSLIFNVRARQLTAIVLFLTITAGLLPVSSVSAQNDLPDPTANLTLIPANSLIIPMDEKQNTESNGGCPSGVNANTNLFNLKAYGLAQRLLQANIPLKWAIKANKAKDDADFTGMAEQVFPTAGSAASTSFSAGPFIISAEYVPAATPVINAFRLEVEDAEGTWPASTVEPTACDDNAASRVRVYRLTVGTNIDIRHTLTHKPVPAYGAANGGLGGAVHAELFETALITNYSVVDDTTVSPTTCSTIATQPHSENPSAFVDNYRAFVVSGGNLLLQCRSVTNFENVAVHGFFQTTAGWVGTGQDGIDTLHGTPYPNGDMPFSQFLGAIRSSQHGGVEDFRLNGGSFANGNFPVIRSADSGGFQWYQATNSKVGNVGRPGGMVFSLGGHNYFRDSNNDVDLDQDRYNGLRMVLNALFVPVTRPEGCLISLGLPNVLGFKSVRLGTETGDDVNGNGIPNRGDTLVWTINYVNTGSVAAANFQIADTVPTQTTYVGTPAPQPVVSHNAVNGTVAAANITYSGSGNLLVPGAILGVGGRITVKIRTKVKNDAFGTILNQSFATATNLPGSIASDQIDNGHVNPNLTPAQIDGNIPQANIAGLQPTEVAIAAPTSAAVVAEGRVVGSNGRGLANVGVQLMNHNTGTSVSVPTNSFGYFKFTDLTIGNFYTVGVFSKRYEFPNPLISFSPSDNVSDLMFVGDLRGDDLIAPKSGKR